MRSLQFLPLVVLRFAVPLAALAMLAFARPAGASDSDWPRQFDSPSGSFVIYQPQPERLDGDLVSCRAAFSLQASGDDYPTFGVLWFTEQIEIDRDNGTVNARDLDVAKVRLPGITATDASRYEKLIESEARRWDLSGSLDELTAGLASAEKERASIANLDNTPPKILFVYERAILVVYDGAPTLEPIEGSRIERVANTPYVVIRDPATSNYYLNGANLWYRAKDPLGPWAVVPRPPASVRAVVPPDTSSDDQVEGPPPRVVTATVPTELIAIEGEPKFAPLVDDELLYVTNTESDVVRTVSPQALYVLLAGRWYRASTASGPWTFVRGDQLPAVFRRVPPDSPRGNLLTSVAGTDQADDAVADAEIPQTSAIRRDDAGFEVAYDGEPEFESIDGTRMQYAVNSDAEVILADGAYYACDQGVWYIADDPDGPWRVSESRPIEVDDIPPSCPVYDVRYVYIYDATPSYVYMGYLPGYVGCYPYYGTVVYGTGHRYSSWRGHHYYPRPYTWGFHPRYNPWLNRWSFGMSYGAGFLRTGFRWHRGSQSQRPHSPPRWFGPAGYRRPLLAHDRTILRTRPPRRTPRISDGAPMNLYHRSANVARVDRPASRLPLRRIAPRPLTRPNNVFAGKDGKVYQRDGRGNWKVNEGRQWRPTRVPDNPPATPGVQTPGVGPGSAGRPSLRKTRPDRPVRSDEPSRTPRFEPLPRPEPPSISPAPGDLEREYRGRQRGSENPPPDVAPPPKPADPPPPLPKRTPRRKE